MLTAERPGADMQRPVYVSGTAARTGAVAAEVDACPDDCHYCSGPETD